MEEAKLLNEIVETEKRLTIDDIEIKGVPLWRIVRYHTRLYYINKRSGYIAGSPTTKEGKKRLKVFSGFWHFVGKKDLRAFFPFNRLVNMNGKYIDKFTDPVIEESSLCGSNFLVVDPSDFVGDYARVHKKEAISNEGRTIAAQVLKQYYEYITPRKYGRLIRQLYGKIREPFLLDDAYLNRLYFEVSHFLFLYHYYHFWFRILRPKSVFVVYREGYFPQIAVCKKMGIPVAEFQHGITLDNTVSFAGEYDHRIDPDYFLVFGEYWKGPQFGMPLDRIINIGWAYSKYLQKTIAENTEKHDKEVLVISSPEISDAILDTLQELSNSDSKYSFDIRLHPCESYNEAQQEKLKSIPRAQIVDNKTDSALVLPTYRYVVGENSSVIYEALSVGCKVGMLNMCGLRPAVDLPGIKDNFFIINNREDFERFLTEDSNQSTSKAEFYSEFDSKHFMDFIENKM